MFKTFFFTEIRYVLKQPLVYIFLGVFGLMAGAAVVSDVVMIGGSVGNIFENSPHTITMYTSIMCIFGLLVAAAFFNNAALRDHAANFNEIMFSTPLSKAGYFFGRFFGALIMATIPMLGVFLGVLIGGVIGPAFGWIDPERIGPYFLETFVNNYFLFILPNMFFAGAIIYAIAIKWKSTMISFMGALGLIVAYIAAGTLMSDIDNETTGALLDSFGIRGYFLHAKYFTPSEKNTLSPSFSGVLLYNRLIWGAVGTLILFLSYLSFSFKQKFKKAKTAVLRKNAPTSVLGSFVAAIPVAQKHFSGRAQWAHFKSFFVVNFLNITKSVVFKIILVFCAVLLLSNLKNGFGAFGLQTYPVTYKLFDIISGLSELFVLIIIVFFSGELIWRDRDNKIHEVVDSSPHSSFISLLAKTLSLTSIIAILHFSFVLIAILYQLTHGFGFDRIDMDLYLQGFFYTSLPLYLFMSGLMVFIQVLFNNKYLSYFVSILLLFVWGSILTALDLDSNMLVFGGRPSMTYSDMNGFGPSFSGVKWFSLYWMLLSLVLLLLAGTIWNRGVLRGIKERVLGVRKQMPKYYPIVLGAATVLWLSVTGFVYYNTQVLNTYSSADESEQMRLEYEQLYKKYETIDMPKINDVKYHIDIYPHDRNVFVRGLFVYVNENDHALDSICYSYDPEWHPIFDIPNSTLLRKDSLHDFIVFGLDPPLQPGASMDLEISTKYLTQGFENEVSNFGIVRNGSFLNSKEIMPSLGYRPGAEISDKNKRRKLKLPPKDRMPKLEHNCGTACNANYLSDGLSDFINIESYISTSGDQRAVAPGSLVKEWTKDGRNHYHYKVDHPSQHFFSFISARFAIATRKWNDLDIEVYYDKKHGVNVDMMLDAVERSLEYYTSNFGPYYHKQCRIIEFPRYASFAQAFPGTMPYSESIGFIINLEDEDDNNVVDAVIAHEMAHQWWAHQVIGAEMQGGTMMSESFSEYSSLMTMKGISKTPMKMREFLKYDHNRYLRGRSREIDKEQPLYKVENQMHIHYGKGSVILYALQDYIGEDKVNAAMRSFLEEYKYKGPPYPSSLDFIRHLEVQVPDSLNYLITDWFKEITLYDNRMKEATYKALDNGQYELTVRIESAKIKADTLGKESRLPINDWIDIGAFADRNEKDLIFEKRVKIDEPSMTFTFVLDTIPAKMAIDPRHLLIDRVYDDNSKVVTNSED